MRWCADYRKCSLRDPCSIGGAFVSVLGLLTVRIFYQSGEQSVRTRCNCSWIACSQIWIVAVVWHSLLPPLESSSVCVFLCVFIFFRLMWNFRHFRFAKAVGLTSPHSLTLAWSCGASRRFLQPYIIIITIWWSVASVCSCGGTHFITITWPVCACARVFCHSNHQIVQLLCWLTDLRLLEIKKNQICIQIELH